jgi:hypothetical protein
MMDFDDRPLILKEALVVLTELQTEEEKYFDCLEIAEAFKKKFLNLLDLQVAAMSHRIGICLSSAYKKDPTSIARKRNEAKNKRKGGTYLYGVVMSITTEIVNDGTV